MIIVGSKILDNDPRVHYQRKLTVVELCPEHVIASNEAGRRVRVQLKRIHTDQKPRKTGFTLISP